MAVEDRQEGYGVPAMEVDDTAGGAGSREKDRIAHGTSTEGLWKKEMRTGHDHA